MKITVKLVAGAITQPDQVPQGGGTVTINGSASTGGLVSPVYHLWEYCMTGCSDDDNWYLVTDNTGGYGGDGFSCENDGTGLNYSSCTITSNLQLRRRDMDGEQVQVSNMVLVNVKTSNPTGTAADISAPYSGGAVCQDTPASFTVTLTASVTSPVVIVYDANGNEVAQKATAPFTFTVNPPTAPTTTYYVAFKGSNYAENLPIDRKSVAVPVTAKMTPTISIESNAANNTIAPGTSVTFTATASNLGGGSATYEWNVNGTTVQTNSSNTFSTNTLSNGAIVNSAVTVGGGCVTIPQVMSNSISMAVTQNFEKSCEGFAAFAKASAEYRTSHPYYAYYIIQGVGRLDDREAKDSGTVPGTNRIKYVHSTGSWIYDGELAQSSAATTCHGKR